MPRTSRKVLQSAIQPVIARVARAYIAGATPADAATCARRMRAIGKAATIGYWDGKNDTPESVFTMNLSALRAAEGLDFYLSIKLPALGFRYDLVAALQRQAGDIWLHCDALDYTAADRTRTMIEDVGPMGFTLPGRWQRSEDDADWTSDYNLPVRVVKGQWPDPNHPHRDLREGFLRVIDRLAGRSAPVFVATHDSMLAEISLLRLRDAGTPCMLELLYGLPERESLAMANRLGVAVRQYIPFGTAYLPYTLGVITRKPRTLFWLLKDALTGPAAPSPRAEITHALTYPRSTPRERSRTR